MSETSNDRVPAHPDDADTPEVSGDAEQSMSRLGMVAPNDDALERRVLATLPVELPSTPDVERLDAHPRIGVVLGAGGVLGNAYLAGAIAALHLATGFEPRDAAVLVGTSAGSVHAAMYGAGLPALFGLWRARGGRLPDGLRLSELATDRMAATHEPSEHDEGEGHTLRTMFTPARALPRLGPSGPTLLARGLLRPWAFRPEVLLSAVLPEGLLSNAAIGEALRRIVPSGWVRHPRTWITTVNLRTGARTCFGKPTAPRAHLDRAVRASCAIPGLYRAVRIGRDRYIDGGVHSPSNADLLAGLDLDLIVILNPMSTLEGHAAVGFVDRHLGRLRHFASRRLAADLRTIEEHDVPTLVIQPGARDLEVFSANLMDPRPRRAVAERAVETVSDSLAEADASPAATLLRASGRRRLRAEARG